MLTSKRESLHSSVLTLIKNGDSSNWNDEFLDSNNSPPTPENRDFVCVFSLSRM